MRFKLSAFESITIIATASYVLYLGALNDLDLYLPPRYVVFTVAMSIIALLITLIRPGKTRDHSKDDSPASIGTLPLVLVLVVALLLPARTLTSSTVSQRAIDSGITINNSGSAPISSLFAGSSRGLGLADWATLLSANQNSSYYLNKPAKVSGFVYDANLGPDHVWLARFVLTCCAVDAQPIGVPVRIENWAQQYDEDQWLEVEGLFVPNQTQSGEQIVLVPDTVNEIDQPENPYAN